MMTCEMSSLRGLFWIYKRRRKLDALQERIEKLGDALQERIEKLENE
jgi:hypothetical protein